ncbi:uncharacterized protein LOC142233380 [Haematobia irritans]|uniref:uncharacterized protein LOC142233380 n=1 Tax=Haematobia irritans TaxID=7368 RepID=UPI003F503DE2
MKSLNIEFNRTLVSFLRCDLKVVGRGVIALNVHAKVNYTQPILNGTMNISLFKKANGYRPFLYNYTMDFCDFFKNRKRYPFVKIYWDTVLKNTNLNHSCPYNHDIIVRNATLNEDMFRYMPLPSGEYMFKLRVAICNHWVAETLDTSTNKHHHSHQYEHLNRTIKENCPRFLPIRKRTIEENIISMYLYTFDTQIGLKQI